MSMYAKEINLTVNGNRYILTVNNKDTLLSVLREKLAYTGVKEGCGLGDCGACTVIIAGQAVLACQILAVEVDGEEILTLEGLTENNTLHPIQKAFMEEGAIQCGFCTPGMVMSAKALLDANPHPSEYEIKKAIGGNICRCTGYTQIIQAIDKAAKEMRGEKNA